LHISEKTKPFDGRGGGVTTICELREGPEGLTTSYVGAVREVLIKWSYNLDEVIWRSSGHTGDIIRVVPVHHHYNCSTTVATIVTSSHDTTIRMWNQQTGGCIRVLTLHNAPVRGLASINHGGFVSASDDGALRVWNRDGECVRVIDADDEKIISLTRLRDGSIVSGGSDGRITIRRR